MFLSSLPRLQAWITCFTLKAHFKGEHSEQGMEALALNPGIKRLKKKTDVSSGTARTRVRACPKSILKKDLLSVGNCYLPQKVPENVMAHIDMASLYSSNLALYLLVWERWRGERTSWFQRKLYTVVSQAVPKTPLMWKSGFLSRPWLWNCITLPSQDFLFRKQVALWRLGKHWARHKRNKARTQKLQRRTKSMKLKENVGNTYPLVFCWVSSWDACLEAGVSTLSEAHSGCHLEDHARNGLKFHITEDYFRKKAKSKSIHFP